MYSLKIQGSELTVDANIAFIKNLIKLFTRD